MFSENHPEDAEIAIFNDVYALYSPLTGELSSHPSAPEKTARPEREREIELDLGCGSGSFTVKLARRFPGRIVLAADVMIGRLRKLVRRAGREKLSNIRFLRAEGRILLSIMLPDASLDRIHLLCPDPWPKDRHRGHRLVTSDFCAQLFRVLKTGGVFHFSSDDVPYFESVTRVVSASGLFELAPPEAAAEISDLKSDFETRWLEQGKLVRHVFFRKKI